MASSTPTSFGRYQIKTEIGRGGMAVVYHALDPRFGREVAIKVLPHQFLFDPQFRERFEREAKTVAMLEHDAIVPVYDFGEEDGQPFIVMRYMAGGSLEQRLKRGPMPLQEIVPVFTRLAGALDVAHAAGVIHRDLKPGNILFDRYNKAFLSDFGIARLTQAGFATMTGSAIVGTPTYMSPEQVEGEKDLDGRSDVYALGVVLFQMLTGNAPYQASTPAKVLIMHLMEPVPRITKVNADLTPEFDTLIERAMAKGRDQRFQTAGDMAHALETALSLGITPVPENAPLSAGAPPQVEPLPTVIEEQPPVSEAVVMPEKVAAHEEPILEEEAPVAEAEQSVGKTLVDDAATLLDAPAVLITELSAEPQAGPIEIAPVDNPPAPDLQTVYDAPRVPAISETYEPQVTAPVAPVAMPKTSKAPWVTLPANWPNRLRSSAPWLAVLIVCLGLIGGVAFAVNRLLTQNTPIVATGAETSQVYFTSNRDGQREIYLLSRNGGIQQITSSPAGSESWGGVPAPGGGFYFTSTRSGRRQAYRMTGAGEVQQITSSDGESWGAVPASSGGVYFTSTRSGKREIYRMTGEGDVLQITSTADDAESWGAAPYPNGGVAFTSTRSGKREIYRMTQTGEVAQITSTPGNAESWGAVPLVGGGMLFTSDRSGKAEVYRMNPDGGVSQLTHTAGNATSWGPTPAEPEGLYFNSDRDGKKEIYWMSQDGSIQRVTNSPTDRQSWLTIPGSEE
jgi:serine/threonine protein kinase/Tol biopolymer transport system component